MNLLPKLKKKQTGQVGVATAVPPTTVLGDLTSLAELIQPIRSRMAEYDQAIHALAVARERLRDLDDATPPDMTLTVKRELAAAMDNPDALARFDVEQGSALEAERAARVAARLDREELPARINALEAVVRQIAIQMIDWDRISAIESKVQVMFAPYALRLVEAAKRYAEAMQQARTASRALDQATMVYEYDLFLDLKLIHHPELMGKIEIGEILPRMMTGVSLETTNEINVLARTES